jgi:hypothetical protein
MTASTRTPFSISQIFIIFKNSIKLPLNSRETLLLKRAQRTPVINTNKKKITTLRQRSSQYQTAALKSNVDDYDKNVVLGNETKQTMINIVPTDNMCSMKSVNMNKSRTIKYHLKCQKGASMNSF